MYLQTWKGEGFSTSCGSWLNGHGSYRYKPFSLSIKPMTVERNPGGSSPSCQSSDTANREPLHLSSPSYLPFHCPYSPGLLPKRNYQHTPFCLFPEKPRLKGGTRGPTCEKILSNPDLAFRATVPIDYVWLISTYLKLIWIPHKRGS